MRCFFGCGGRQQAAAACYMTSPTGGEGAQAQHASPVDGDVGESGDLSQTELLHLLLVLGKIFSPAFLLAAAGRSSFGNFGTKFLPSVDLVPKTTMSVLTKRHATTPRVH